MKLGSLFDGAGTFPFAASLCGIVPTWASEIEPFPIEVTKKRLPKMKHIGDVTKIDGSLIEPVDIITFGSPCQDLSVAGKRAGLDGERSGLFLEAIRIIKEMRGKTNGKYPRYAVWENVPGAFSSNNGEDFRTVLEQFCKVKDDRANVPRPTGKGKWRTAGLILGNGYSIAWRVSDAEFWGVPQRRRRIFLVADFGGECAGEILFEQKGLQRSFAESRKAWSGITPNTTYCPDTAGRSDGLGIRRNGDNPPPIIPIENHPADSRVTLRTDGIIQTLTSRMGTGGGNTPLVLVQGLDTYNQQLTGDKAKTLLAGHIDPDGVPCVIFNMLQDAVPNDKVSPCLSTGNPKTGQANLAVCHPPVFSIDRAAFNQGENAQYRPQINDDGIAQTLVAKGPGAICYPVGIHGDIAGTLDSNYWKGCGERNGTEREIVACLQHQKWVVRRVTPTECARLQGMPDWWCKDIKHSDSAEYKLWGNGMALPCTLYIMQGLARVNRKQMLTKLEVRC